MWTSFGGAVILSKKNPEFKVHLRQNCLSIFCAILKKKYPHASWKGIILTFSKSKVFPVAYCCHIIGFKLWIWEDYPGRAENSFLDPTK